jgi:predicted transcriptional regulator
MEVHFTPEQEARLSQVAAHAGKDVEQLVRDVAIRLLEEDTEFRAAVRKGIAQADRGELIEEEEVDNRVKQMFQS